MSFLSIHDKDFDTFENLKIPISIIKKIRFSDVPQLGKYVVFGDDLQPIFNSYKYNENAKNLYKLLKSISGIKAELAGINVYVSIQSRI